MDKPEQAGKTSDLRKQIDSIMDLTSRVDERVRSIAKDQTALHARLDRFKEIMNDYNARISVLESQKVYTAEDKRTAQDTRDQVHELDVRVEGLEKSTINQEQRWKAIFSYIVQLTWVILAAYLLYKLGIQAPNVP